MEIQTSPIDLPSQRFEPRIYDVGAWTPHLYFGYDLVATLRPRVLVELGVDRGESFFTFCQSTVENKTGTHCYGVDTWRGDQHAGGYDDTTFAQVSAYNRANYESFATLIRASFDDSLDRFEPESVDLLHIDGLHTENAVRHDVDSWLPKVKPGGIVLLHDVDVRAKNFGVWKVWDDLQRTGGRSWTFHDGPGLGVWQKPPSHELPIFLEHLLAPPNGDNASIAHYYSQRARELQEKIATHWRDGTIRDTPSAQQTIIQIFHSKDGAHRDEDSVLARVDHQKWRDVRITLPPGVGAAPIRIDFVSPLTIIEIASIKVSKGGVDCYSAADQVAFARIDVRGDAERLPNPAKLQIKVTGIDPQLFLPVVNVPENGEPLVLQMRLYVMPMP